jgi:2-octaprenyl-6-methoxyphenol hydroxylase
MPGTAHGEVREHADIVVVGAGPVGSALALALRDSGLSVLLLEARSRRSADRRSLALSCGSRLLLQRLGVWDDLPGCTPIESIHVSQRAGFGRSLLSAADAGLPALGYVVPYAELHQALSAQLPHCPDTRVRADTEVLDIVQDGDAALVSCRTHEQTSAVRASLAVLADGGTLAQTAASHRGRDYLQSALVADVSTDRPHANRAYERFTPSGPIALLPAGTGFALVWTARPEQADRLAGLDDDAFLCALQEAFGERAGRFRRCSSRAAYPLALRVAGAPRCERVLLLGNAAQTLHPVAGQGLNLGLRDAWQLARLAQTAPAEVGTQPFLAGYRRARRPDRLGTIALTDLLVSGFSNDLAPLRWLRGFGLTFLDALPPAKKAFIERMTFGG